MNVCLITFQYPPMINGGVGNAVYRIARNLGNAGCNIHIIAPGSNQIEDPIRPVWEEGVTVHRMFPGLGSYSGDPIELREAGNYVIKLHEEVDFDLVHGIFLIPSGLVGAVVAREIERPFIASIRGSDVEVIRYSPILFGTMKWVLEQASLVTSLTSDLLKKANQIADIRESRVIPNVFDPTVFDPRSLREVVVEQGWRNQLLVEWFLRIKSRGGPVVGTTSIIRPVKGIPFLLEGFKDLIRIYPDACLLIVGDSIDPNEKKKVVRLIKTLGLKRRVFITGQVPHQQVLAWIQEMDIFVLPSLYEGTSNALLEAMSAGLPIIASDIGGPRDLITNGKNGLLVPPRSVDMLLQKLEILAQDEKFRRQLGESAKLAVEAHFSPGREINSWLEAYHNVIGVPFRSEKNFNIKLSGNEQPKDLFHDHVGVKKR